MSELSSLAQLANFSGQSRLTNTDAATRRALITSMAQRMQPRPARKKVGEMLGLVLALSSRTRRIVQPRVGVDLDVFSPAGTRAVQLQLGALDHDI